MPQSETIYNGLECHCNQFQQIPITRRDFGIAGNISTYGIAIGESYTVKKIDNLFNKEAYNKHLKHIPIANIKMNAGIVSFLQAKIEGKSNERALKETGVGMAVSSVTTSKIAVKTGVSLFTRITTGAVVGGASGSVAPIVGTIAGAIVGALIAGWVNDKLFEEEDKQIAQDIAENERITRLENLYINKLNLIKDYLLRNNYIELRVLTESESEELCKFLVNPKINHSAVIKLMLSFKNYLKQDKNSSKQSTAQSNNATPTKPTNQAKSQPTPTNITNPLHILLYLEDAITPLNDITIKLTPNHIKDSTKPQDSIQERISKNGKVTFNIPSNANTFDLEIIDDRFYPQSKSYTQRVTNSYYKGNNTIKLYLLAKIWLYFNGEKIFIMRGNKIVETFRAYSGNALNLAQKQNLIKERGYTQFVSYVNVEDSNKIMYFCLDKHWQRQKDKGSMVEGNYFVNISDIRDRWTILRENKFGKNTRIYTDESCTNTTESTTQRSDFYLHGGDKYGNAGGIDLAKGASSFFNRLETLKEQIINNEVESKDNPIIIKLVVDYSALGIEIDYIDLTRELQTKSQNPQINTEKHKVILTANYIKPKSMPNEVFSAQKPQTYWAYKEIKKDKEFDFDNEVNMSNITHFTSEDGQKYIGESVEIDLVKYGWEDYRKQIVVFAYLQKDINRENPKLVINNPKWRIITWYNPIVNPRVTIYSSSGKGDDMSIGMFGKIENRISKVHKALDFFAKVGTNVYAPLDCEVANVDKKQDTNYGKYITLKVTGQSLEILKIRKEAINYQLIYDYAGEMEQGDKFDEDSKQYYLFYAHLSQINKNIKKGTKVLAGQIIGKSGVTGNAKGTSAPHLHFEIRSNENAEPKKLTYLVNPAFYIEFKKLVSEFSQDEKEEQQKVCKQNNADKERCNLSVILDIED